MEQGSRVIAGVDVHKKMLAVVVRAGDGAEAGSEYSKRKFGTTKLEIQALAAWLSQHRVTEVVMESTAQYWRPVWYGLEFHFQLHLTHPLKTRAPKGRKSDYRDAQRLADRWHSGDLEESFVPLAEQRSWRWLTRSRVQARRKLSAIYSEVEGILEEGGIKLSAVVSDLFGVSGWAMLEKVAAGEQNLDEMLGLARGALRKKKAQLKEALAGQLAPTYRLLLKHEMEQVRLLRQQLQEVNEVLAVAMREQVTTLHRLSQMPGVDLYAAQDILAEIGPGAMAFPSAGNFASWVGVCPGSKESAGVNYSNRSAKGNRFLRRILCQVAWAAIHTKDTFFSSLFARLKPRIEGKGAAWAVAHRIAKVIWIILHNGMEYIEKGAAPMNPRTLRRKLRRLVAEFGRQGLDVKALLEQELAAKA